MVHRLPLPSFGVYFHCPNYYQYHHFHLLLLAHHKHAHQKQQTCDSILVWMEYAILC